MQSTTIPVNLSESNLKKIEDHWKNQFFYHINLCIGSYEKAIHFNLAIDHVKTIREGRRNFPKQFKTAQKAFDFINSPSFCSKNLLKPDDINLFVKEFSTLSGYIEQNTSVRDRVKYHAAYEYALNKTFYELNHSKGWTLNNLNENASNSPSLYSTHSANIVRTTENIKKTARQYILQCVQNQLIVDHLANLENHLDSTDFLNGNQFKRKTQHLDSKIKRKSVKRIVPRHAVKIYTFLDEAYEGKRSAHSAACLSAETIILAAATKSVFRSKENTMFYVHVSANIEKLLNINVEASITMMRNFLDDTFPKTKKRDWNLFSSSSRSENIVKIENALAANNYKEALVLAAQFSKQCGCRSQKEQHFLENLRFKLMFTREDLEPAENLGQKTPVLDLSQSHYSSNSDNENISQSARMIRDVEQERKTNPAGIGRTISVSMDSSSDEKEKEELERKKRIKFKKSSSQQTSSSDEDEDAAEYSSSPLSDENDETSQEQSATQSSNATDSPQHSSSSDSDEPKKAPRKK